MENTARSTSACMPAVAGNAFLWVKNSTIGSKYCKRHKCVYCCRKAVWRGRLKRRGYCRTHTCHTDFCGAGTMSKGARSCKRHKCAYCNSAVIGYRGGFHNRHCKKHSCLMCLNGTTSATAQVCQNHACRHPRCFGRCRRGIADDARGRATATAGAQTVGAGRTCMAIRIASRATKII